MIFCNKNVYIHVQLATFKILMNKFAQNVKLNIMLDAQFVHLKDARNA